MGGGLPKAGQELNSGPLCPSPHCHVWDKLLYKTSDSHLLICKMGTMLPASETR